jgi:hypothetical protein
VSGDYTRFTFKPRNRFSGVLQQQGRVQLDSDWNEAVDIIKHRLEVQALDTFGPVGVPFLTTKDAFKVSVIAGGNLAIEPGRLYVDGLLVEAFAEEAPTYLNQPFFPDPDPDPLPAGNVVVYLDVWEREVTYVEDPALLDVALGGADTATRTQTVWQLRVDPRDVAECGATIGEPPSDGLLSTDAVTPPPPDDPCLLPPLAGYRGIENRLYRVEIQEGGALGTALFKWSRDNGSIVSPVTDIDAAGLDTWISVKLIGRDQFLRFNKGNWVTVTDDHRELHGEPGDMAVIDDIDETNSRLLLKSTAPLGTVRAFGATPGEIAGRHTRVQRWDQNKDVNTLDADGLMTTGAGPIGIEDGITVSFGTKSGGDFRVGDYWVFWARTATASVEILTDAPPRGIHHHYVQLAAITGLGGADPEVEDCRPKPPKGECCCCLITVGTNEDRPADYETLAQAIAALPVIAPDTSVYVIVCLDPGEHEVPTTVTVARPRTTIRGCGFGSHVNGGEGPVIRLAGSEQALEHVSVVSETDGPTIEVTGSAVRIERCRIHNQASGPAIASVKAFGLTITGCEVLGTHGMALGGYLIDVIANQAFGGPVLVRNGTLAVRIHDNRISGSVSNGITLGENGFTYLIDIARNRIEGAQAVGIAAGSQTDPAGGDEKKGGVFGLLIDANQIQDCQGGAYKWGPGQAPAGGISLTRTYKTRITDNLIVGNGTKASAPVCGVWIGSSRGLIIKDNWIEANRPPPEAQDLAVTQGGIRLEEAWTAIADPALEKAPVAISIAPAAEISENYIDAPLGHALYAAGEGPMIVRDNRMRSYGLLPAELKTPPKNSLEQLARQYSSVFIFNLGYPTMFSLLAQLLGFNLLGAQPNTGTIAAFTRRILSGGQVRFTGNQVRIDLRDPDIALVPAHIGILTLDDCLFAHNQTEGLINVGQNTIDAIFIDALIGAITTRQSDNGLFTPPILTFVSLLSVALVNHCVDNQAASCVLPFAPRLVRQNNTVLVPNAFCPVFAPG